MAYPQASQQMLRASEKGLRMSAQWLKVGIEPSLEDLLDDPITQLLMRRDGLDRDQICRLLRTVRSARAAAAAFAPAAG